MLGLCCSVGFPGCSEQGLLSSWGTQASHCGGFSCCGSWALGQAGFSSCGVWAQQLWLPGCRAQAQKLWCTGLVAPQHLGSSWIGDQTCVSCISRRILHHWATREAPWSVFELIFKYTSRCGPKFFFKKNCICISILVSWGCHNKLPHIRWLKTTEVYPLTVLEVRRLKGRCWQGHAPSGACMRKSLLHIL